MNILDVENLSVNYGDARAVQDVSLTIADGELVGLLGESGSGKSTLGNAVLRLLDPPARISSGTVRLGGTDITTLDESALRPLRWRTYSTVFQSSMNALNPVITVEAQFRDTLARAEQPVPDVHARIVELLEMVLIEPRFMRSYPHELSGGMKQRVALAMALALEPRLVVLDEPTTGLDVVVQRSILDNLRALQKQRNFAVLLISHDLGTVLEVADRLLVMYAGRIVESLPAGDVRTAARHPYTRGLLDSYADPRAETVDIAFIPGRPPELTARIDGCAFAPRCPLVIERCGVERPALLGDGAAQAACHVAGPGIGPVAQPQHTLHVGPGRAAANDPEPLLRVDGVSRSYAGRGRRAARIEAVRDVSFEVGRGEVVALVGQSGSGKTTLGRLVTGIERPDSGTVEVGETAVHRLRGRALRAYRSRVQLVFQDPFAALNPTRPIAHALLRPLANYHGLRGDAARARAEELLESVGLSPASSYLERFPYQLSGGQRQRVVIARALAPEPELLVADEPVSMLDVSVRAELLALLASVVAERGLGMLYITHDLLSARVLADRVLVLRAGELVESGTTEQVIRRARDPYTQLLLDALPNPFTLTGGPA